MDMINEPKMQIAVLIDSENVSSRYASIIFNEIESYGFATYRRIYGNWTKNNGWNENLLLENSITPIQQFDYTFGKNSADIAMVIDAMDILYSGNVDGFCLVTSDSDFTRLAMRLREANMYVIGMGESKTPVALTKACNKFIHLNLIYEQPAAPAAEVPAADDHLHEDYSTASSAKTNAVTSIGEIEEAIISIVNDNENKGKTTYMGEIGSRLSSKFTDFDVRNYGYTKLSKFLSAFDGLSLSRHNNVLFVSLRQNHLDADTVRSAIVAYVRDWERARNGKLNLGQLNQWLTEQFPQFNVKNYGYTTFVKFVSDIHGLSVRSSGKNGRIKHVQLIQ